MQRPDAQRAHRNDLYLEARPFQTEREPVLALRALGAEKTDRFVFKSAKGEVERLARRRVEPLDIVDRDEHRSFPRESAQRIPDCGRDGVMLRRQLGRFLEQERDTGAAKQGR
jgi:hypothetical protein